MSKIEFEGKDGRKKELYTKLWGDFDFEQINASIENTSYNGTKSLNSFSFCANGNKREKLEKIFNISNSTHKIFKSKYEMAIGGPGNEEKKITTLHSSSLCALLHFYNVTKDNPLVIDKLQTDKNLWENVVFTESVFEFKTPVINIQRPSSMDIVLLGKSGNKELILFLESKFSEYYLYSSKALHNISNEYLNAKYTANIYTAKNFSDMGITIKEDNDKEFSLYSDDSVYLGGIKQMISHYCGIRNFIDGRSAYEPNPPKDELNIRSKIKTGAVIILGEIVFDNIIGDLEVRPHLNCLNSYSEKYTKLARLINREIQKVDTLEMLQKELGYSLFKSNNHKLETNIRLFYRYE